ncbi:hypothetical protein [Nitrosomonas supralitoralis]|uniref:Uncharacterized protein n=1 Tax=Nitrosomonas supralitoralis TaxID=2116706 RepID=A0A2P7NR23_9PROT|nr:hypothetical protein [Nitrosomonas supralitoralis]PSJ15887.1 hypothetical protein C7H79_16555 [Nitrosomonas supralitoralis]
MNNQNRFGWFVLIFTIFIFASTDVLSGPDNNSKETYKPQNVQVLESGRTNQLKKDADLRGRTEENKGNFDKNVPRGKGIEYPPAKNSGSAVENPDASSGTKY